MVTLRDAPSGTSLRSRQEAILGRLGLSPGDDVTLFATVPALSLYATEDQIARLRSDADVVSVSDDRTLSPIGDSAPDSGPGTEFKGFFLSQTTKLIGADAMWRSGYDGDGWNIAIVDVGIDSGAKPLRGKLVDEACFSSQRGIYQSLCRGEATTDLKPGAGEACPASIAGCDHGSHLAAAAAANPRSAGENELGVAKDAGLISIKVASKVTKPSLCDPNPAPCALIRESDLQRGLEYLYENRDKLKIGAVVVGLAGVASEPPCSSATPFRKLIDKMVKAQIPVVAGAGNAGLLNQISFPACVPGVVSVGSTGKIHTPQYLVDMVPETTNLDDDLALMAPGEKIRTFFGNISGTSMSAAHVAGAITLMRDFKPREKIETLVSALECNGDLVERSQFVQDHSVHTRVNVLRAAQYLGPEGPPLYQQSFNSPGPPIGWVSAVGAWGTRNGEYRLLTPAESGGPYTWSGAAVGICGSDFEILTSIRRDEADRSNYNTAIMLTTDLPTVEAQARASGYFFSFNNQGGPHMQLLRITDYNFKILGGEFDILCDTKFRFNPGKFFNFYVKRQGKTLIVGVNGQGACSFEDETYTKFKSMVVLAAHSSNDSKALIRLNSVRIKTLKR